MSDLQTLSRLLDEALDLDLGEIDPWLAALPSEHSHLMPRLRKMLDEHRRMGQSGFMADGPKIDDDQTGDDPSEQPGDRIGPYRLVEEVGRGGMGTVWRAERADGSWSRQVALKLPRLTWGAGLVKRMARERDFSARLEHPNIARLYDAGVDPIGRPFIAMEYIEGRHLDAYLQAEAPGLAERLRLFVRIARAVAYAHRHLVVHRDIKPSNVMISADGEPHLLDFGIAKSLQVAGSMDETSLTREIGKILTPRYASPEQLRGEDITVGSDVYSLGVLLYEMLTGGRPHQPQRESLAALEEAILNDEPPLASSRARSRAAARALSGELDAILAKSLRRDVEARYTTADAFADDVERYLSGDAVLARPDSLGYRFSKGLRRHRVVVATASVVLASVLAGAGIALVQAGYAKREAARANSEARRATAEAARAQAALLRASTVKNFIVDIFKVNSRDDPAKVALRQLPAELLLDNAAAQIESRFAGQLDLQSELFGIVARILLDMNSPAQALTYANKQAAALNANASAEVRSEAALLRSEVLSANLRKTEAEQAARDALSIAPGGEARVKARLLLAQLLQRQGRYTEAKAELNLSAAELNGKPALAPILEASQQYLEAMFHAEQSRIGPAQTSFQKAIVTALAAEGPSSRLASRVRVTYAHYLAEQGAGDTARAMFEDAFAALRASGGSDDVEAALLEAESVSILAPSSVMAYDRANSTLLRDLSALDQHASRLPPWVRASVEAIQGCLALESGRVSLGSALVERSTQVLRAAGQTTFEGNCLAFALMESGRHDEADVEFKRLIRESPKRSGANFHTQIAVIRNQLMAGNIQKALEGLDTARAMDNATQPPGRYSHHHPKLFQVVQAAIDLARGRLNDVLSDLNGVRDRRQMMYDAGLIHGEALCRLGRVSEGLPLMQYRLTQLVDVRDGFPYDPAVADARARLGQCELLAGHRAAAIDLARLARDAFKEQPAVAPFFKVTSLELDRELGTRRSANAR